MAAVLSIEVRHHRFETSAYEAFDSVLGTQANAGFGLIRIVPVDDVFSVAVFERTVTETPGKKT